MSERGLSHAGVTTGDIAMEEWIKQLQVKTLIWDVFPEKIWMKRGESSVARCWEDWKMRDWAAKARKFGMQVIKILVYRTGYSHTSTHRLRVGRNTVHKGKKLSADDLIVYSLIVKRKIYWERQNKTLTLDGLGFCIVRINTFSISKLQELHTGLSKISIAKLVLRYGGETMFELLKILKSFQIQIPVVK